jgi:hypothetical protein
MMMKSGSLVDKASREVVALALFSMWSVDQPCVAAFISSPSGMEEKRID